MARNGSGSYSLPEAAFVYNTAISETAVNSNFSDIASALTASLAKDGQTDPTANLPMAGFRHTGVDDATARNDYAAWGQVQDNAANYVTSAGSADAQTLTPTPAIAAYAAGQRFTFKAGSGLTNTGAMTLAVSGLAAKNVKALDGTDPDAGAVTGGNLAVVTYDGTNFVLHGQSTPASARLFLGLGTAALVDTGVSNGNVPAMDGTGYPAADGSQITALAGANITADTVPLTAWAHGTEGGTLYYGASGAPTELAKGTAGQAFVMNSGATAPEWSTLFSTFTSSETALPSVGASATLAHSLTDRTGIILRVVLRCKTTDGGYSADDEVQLPDTSFDGSAEFGWSVAVDDTNIVIVRGANATALYNKSTGQSFTITDGNWRIVAYALRF